jgi:hypothetical protein
MAIVHKPSYIIIHTFGCLKFIAICCFSFSKHLARPLLSSQLIEGIKTISILPLSVQHYGDIEATFATRP